MVILININCIRNNCLNISFPLEIQKRFAKTSMLEHIELVKEV